VKWAEYRELIKERMNGMAPVEDISFADDGIDKSPERTYLTVIEWVSGLAQSMSDLSDPDLLPEESVKWMASVDKDSPEGQALSATGFHTAHKAFMQLLGVMLLAIPPDPRKAGWTEIMDDEFATGD